MNILENIRNALGAIGSNKMRSALTMLGIIIGVSSVVLMIAIGQGAQRSVTSRLQSLGTNLLSVTPGSSNQTNVRFGGGGGGEASTTLSEDDVEAIRTNIQGLLGIAPELSGRSQVIYGSENVNASLIGATADYLAVRNVSVEYGMFISDQNVANGEKVAVIGPTLLTTLFASEPDPLGKDLRIGNGIYTIIGILKSKGQTGFGNQDSAIVIPLSTMQQRITGKDVVSTISISVKNAADMDLIQQQITAVLMNAHGITDAEKQDFTVANQADAIETLNQVTQIFTLLLGGIAGISLLVGGIGVMNIMLVSVTERTREIGIRKAIGARRRDILLQFLVESTVLSVLGGAIGILLSIFGASLVRTYATIDARIVLSSVLLAFFFSAGIGIFFGMLPAWKAAKLRPIEALRYE